MTTLVERLKSELHSSDALFSHHAYDRCAARAVEALRNAITALEAAEAERDRLAEAIALIEQLQAEKETIAKRAIQALSGYCEKHSGDNMLCFAEWRQKYGDKCYCCAIDENKTLRAERDRLADLAERRKLKIIADAKQTATAADAAQEGTERFFHLRGKMTAYVNVVSTLEGLHDDDLPPAREQGEGL